MCPQIHDMKPLKATVKTQKNTNINQEVTKVMSLVNSTFSKLGALNENMTTTNLKK